MLDYNAGTVRCRDSSLPGQFVAGTVRCRTVRYSSLPHIVTSLHRYYSMTGSVRQCVDLSPGVTGRVDRDFDYNPGN